LRVLEILASARGMLPLHTRYAGMSLRRNRLLALVSRRAH
jgi:hypothetical protein